MLSHTFSPTHPHTFTHSSTNFHPHNHTLSTTSPHTFTQTPSTGLRHPSTTAVFSHAIGSWKLWANEQFFVGAQIVVSLLQTTQIKQGVSFIAANKVYTRTNKTTIVWIETELLFLPGVDASHVYVRALALGCFTVILVPDPFGGSWPRRCTVARI